ncbi:MAG: hypothetical protein JSV42_13700 [Chloroflexota bacterium]|nr:MAG: hypothetical protein JSV42_13700 [Chloroflexota bacterium]
MDAASQAEPKPPDRRISRPAVLGLVCLPLGFLLILLFYPQDRSSILNSPSFGENVWQVVILATGILAPIAATSLGVWSIFQIRRSAGLIFGLPLAVTASLFYPIILLDLILIILGWLIFGQIQDSGLIPLVWFFLILLMDYLIIRLTWKAVSKSPPGPTIGE